MTLTVGALFAGYGGLELGLSSVVDTDLAWYAEFDDAPSRIMAHHHPGVPNLGDVTKVDWAAVKPVDVITGGSPCQDLSHAGKRAGMKAGTRSGLWASMCDAIDIIRPRLVIWENVRGALSASADSAVEPCPICVGDGGGVTLRALGRVLGDLAELGYDARWYGLRAADVGAAHGRFRVFVIASPANADVSGLERLADSSGAAQAGRHGDPVTGAVRPDLTLLPTPAVNDMGEGKTVDAWDAWTAKMQAAHGNGNGHGKSLAIEAQRLLPAPRSSDSNGAGAHGQGGPDLRTVVDLLPTPRATRGGSHTETTALLPTPRATDGTKGGPNQRGSSGDLMLPSAVQLLPTPSVADVTGGRKARSGERSDELLLNGIAAANQWGDYAAAIARWENVTGRPAPAPTETGAKGNPRLSPLFVEWLMGLPAGHVTDVPGITRNQALKALGNGVVPQQCAAAIRAFIHDESEAA